MKTDLLLEQLILFEYTIYKTTTTLNQFLNHLINRKVIIVEINKFFLDHMFNTLKDHNFKAY